MSKGPQDHTLRICAVDRHGAPYDLPVDVEVRHKDLASAPGVKQQQFASGAQIDISGLMRTPQGLYTVLVSPAAQWNPEQQFVTIPASGFATVVVKLQVDAPERLIRVAGGLQVPVEPRYTNDGWRAAIERNPSIPRSFDRVLTLARRLYPRPDTSTLATTGALRDLDECGENIFGNFLEALRNPQIPADAPGLVSALIAGQGITETGDRLSPSGRFRIRWFNGSEVPSWKLEEHLEFAASRLEMEFGVPLFNPSPGGPIEIHVRSMGRIRGQTTPRGAVDLNRDFLQAVAGNESVIRALCAHELFHRIQYSFGFRTIHAASAPFMWFTEGTASRAEFAVAGTVMSEAKNSAFWRLAGPGFFEASYFTMPFWLALERERTGAVRAFFEDYAATGDARGALTRLVAPRNLAHFVGAVYRGAQTATIPLAPAPGEPATLRGRIRELGTVRFDALAGSPGPTTVTLSLTTGSAWVADASVDTSSFEFVSATRPFTGAAVQLLLVAESDCQFSIVAQQGPAEPERSEDNIGVEEIPVPDGIAASVRVDRVGNVVVTNPLGRVTTLGYSLGSGIQASSFGLEAVNHDGASAFPLYGLRPIEQVGGRVVCGVSFGRQSRTFQRIVRDVSYDAGRRRLIVKTTASGTATGFTLDLLQRTQPDSSSRISDLEAECYGTDCDPLTPAGMPSSPVATSGGPLNIEAWEVAPGWVSLRVTSGETGEATIEQEYCLGGCSG